MMSIKLPFSADGIRGLAGHYPLNKHGCIFLGKALGNYVNELNTNPFVMMARDTRPSSPHLYSYIRDGLTSKNIQVQDLEIVSTPALAYLVKNSSASLGVMITASHNSVEYNGVKIIDSDGKRLVDEASIETHLNLLEDNIDDCVEHVYLKSNLHNDLVEKYINDQIAQTDLISLNGLRLVIDCANGAMSRLIPKALEKLGANFQTINQFDGTKSINLRCGTEHFRNHLSEFAIMVQENNADYGISFDGDGDRLMIVDHDGNLYNGDDFLFILGTIFFRSGNLNKHTIVTSHMANSGLLASLKDLGINVVRTQNGDKYLEEQIVQNN